MEKKYQVFISSTYTDLLEARAKVRDAILSMYHFPVGMELFGAANEDQWEIISETIDSSDYYVLIIGQRYGSIIPEGQPGAGISYTEKEYRYALEKGIPVLAFIIDDGVPVKPDSIEKDHVEELAAFKEAVKTCRLVEWWTTAEELARKVTASLYKQISRTKRPGWVRGDSVDLEKSLSEIVELSRQNRELSEENKKLSIEIEKLKKLASRKPSLTLTLDVTPQDTDEDSYPELYSHSSIISIDKEGVVHLTLKHIDTVEQELKYRKLSMNDVPSTFRQYVTNIAIEEYNDNLPSQEELKKYLESYRLFVRLKENGIPITFFVTNTGSAKATDISVTIEFPDQLRVFDIESIGELGELEGPKLPENPIDTAKKRLERERAFALDLKLPYLDALKGITTGMDYSSFTTSIPHFSGNSIFESIEIDDNIVEIEQKQGIVHTKSDCFSGAYIVPIAVGEYEAKVTLMCAEYEEPEETTIKFIVSEED